MIVTVDIGNTNIVVGFWKEEIPLVFRFETAVSKTYDDYFLEIKPVVLDVFSLQEAAEIPGVIWGISSVVPPLTKLIEKVFRSFFSAEPVILDKHLFLRPDFPVKIPETAVDEIGSDIICNAWCAYESKSRTIIVDFGTALTIIGVDYDGEIKGVSIAPGIKTAVKSLFDNTSQLPPDVPLEYPDSVLGYDTFSAIQSGILRGYKGLIKEIVMEMKSELNKVSERPCSVIATGGLSPLIAPHVKLFDKIDGNLTLRGLGGIIKKYAKI